MTKTALVAFGIGSCACDFSNSNGFSSQCFDVFRIEARRFRPFDMLKRMAVRVAGNDQEAVR